MNEKNDWTIMIYMSGDNNLSVDMAYALENIKNVAKNEENNVNLFVYYDGYSPGIPTLYCDFTDCLKPEYYRSSNVKNKLYRVEERFDENSASEFSVLNFVDWCVKKRDATKYGLIFSGHSFGFQSVGLLRDESADHSMTMEKVDWFLGRITKSEAELKKDAGAEPVGKHEIPNKWESDQKVILAQKFDLLGFDSCVMSMLEVGYQFKSFAETMIASEGSVPNAGWAYTEILRTLANREDSANVTTIAEKFVETFIRKQDSYTLGGSAVDMAAWDLKKLDDLNDPFKDLSEKLLVCFDDPGSTIYKQMKRVMIQVHRDCQSYMMEQNVDLGDFCELLKRESISLKDELGSTLDGQLNPIIDACDSVLQQLRECVLLAGFSGGKYQYSNGISLFFPWSIASYNVAKEDYEKLDFIRESGSKWKEFLVKYLGTVSYRKSIESNPEKESLIYSKYKYVEGDHFSSIESGDSKMMDSPASKMMDSPASKMMDSPASKMMDSPASKMMDSPASKMMDSPASKMMDSPASKMMDSPASKMMDSPASKMMDSPASKMGGGGGSGQYLDFFTQFNNVETLWNTSGFTKELEEPPLNPYDAERTIKDIGDNEFQKQ